MATEKAKPQDFNFVVLEAFDETITELLGASVLTALSAGLLKDYDVSREELPNQFDTVRIVLTDVLGVGNSRTILRRVMRRLYRKLGLPFSFTKDADYPPNFYLQQAKQQLVNRTSEGI